MEQNKLDILAFGAHPDDVEIGMGATLAKYADAGYRVGICNLTMAELSSNGTVERRQEEATRAANILGVKTRLQLQMGDRQLRYFTNEEVAEVVSIIRKHRPTFIFSPYEVDRHPDHGACTEIIKEAYFNAGIRRYQCEENLDAYRPDELFFYFINGTERPHFVIDVTEYFERKKAALLAYESQFTKEDDSVDTPLTNGYIPVIEARERLFGKEVGAAYAEGFMTVKPLQVMNLFAGKDRRP